MRVLIVGAGIAGLAAGEALRQRGITADIVERSEEWQAEGSGMYLPANAVRALDELGLADAVEKHGARVERQNVLDHRGRPMASMDVNTIWQAGPCLAIHRADLHRILLEATGKLPIRMGVTVTALGDEVTFSDGSRANYDLVIGADGVHSSIRAMTFEKSPATPVGQVCWRFIAEGFPNIKDWTLYSGPGVNFLTIGIGQDRVYCYADVLGEQAGPTQDWRSPFQNFANPVPTLLEQGKNALQAPIEEVAPPVWPSGKVILIGDAAHASSPNLAQGAAMALEDALVLADHLAHYPIAEALTAYRTRREPRVTWMQNQTHHRDKLRTLPPLIRKLTLRTAPSKFFVTPYKPLRKSP